MSYLIKCAAGVIALRTKESILFFILERIELMVTRSLLALLVIPLSLVIVGCYAGSSNKPVSRAPQQAPVTSADEEAEIKEELAKLSPEDRKLAEAQGYCAVDSDNRLGVMGVPYKVMIKDQLVFLCCKGCAKEAQQDPEKTLAKVKELKEKVAAASKKDESPKK
jgi:hypothetical protein